MRLRHYFSSNEDLKNDFKNIEYVVNDISFSFISNAGVFSKNKIDFGSAFLVETILKLKKKKLIIF